MSDFLNILHSNGALLLMGQYPMGPLGGVLCTLLLSFLALIFSFPVGILVGVARLSPWRWLRNTAACWVYLLRGIPLMMVIFWTYFCVPLLTGHDVSGFMTMLCTLVVYESAYVAEIVRGGILALPSGQTEAARALGMGYLRTLLSVILPQALYNSLPSLISQLVSIVKDTSLGYVINVPELTYAANQVNNQLLTKPVQVFAIVALGYYLINFSLTWLAEALEKRITTKRQAAVLIVKHTTHPFPLTNTQSH